MKNPLLALILLLSLTACASDPVPRPAPIQLNYKNQPPVYLNTQDLNIINRANGFTPRGKDISGQFKPSIVDAVTQWTRDRLQPTGTTGHATLIIKDATITMQALPMKTGVDVWFTRQQGAKYVAKVDIDIEVQQPDGSTGIARANAIHAITLPEEATEAEKYSAYAQLLNALMRTLDQTAMQAIQTHLGRFITAANTPAPP